MTNDGVDDGGRGIGNCGGLKNCLGGGFLCDPTLQHRAESNRGGDQDGDKGKQVLAIARGIRENHEKRTYKEDDGV